MESPRRQVRCGAGVQNTDLFQRETVLKFHDLVAQIFLDSECPLLEERDPFSCCAGFTRRHTLVPPPRTLNNRSLKPLRSGDLLTLFFSRPSCWPVSVLGFLEETEPKS